MKRILFALVTILVVGAGITTASADPTTICFTARLGSGLGAAKVDFLLLEEASNLGLFELSGQASFSQPISPPGSLIVYAVSGAAIPNADGSWVSLSGTGYDLAKTVYRGTFSAQISNTDPTKNTFSYTRQNLDGSGTTTVTSTLPITPCGQ